jgi:hypothetical protein
MARRFVLKADRVGVLGRPVPWRVGALKSLTEFSGMKATFIQNKRRTFGVEKIRIRIGNIV